MKAPTHLARAPASLGLFECLALLAAFVLQIASVMTSVQEPGCSAAAASGKTPATETRGAAVRSCRS